MIKINDKSIPRIFIGDAEVLKIFVGDELVFENSLMYTTEVSKLTLVTTNTYQAAIDHEFELKTDRTYYIKINGSEIEGQLINGTYQGSNQNVLLFQVTKTDLVYIYNKAAWTNNQIVSKEGAALLTCYLTTLNANNIGTIEIFFKDK